MDLPDVQKGMAILAEHIQRLSTAVRQTRLRPGVGYFLRETSGGTSLVINQQSFSQTAALPCPFEVTDASELDGQTLTLKIEIGQDPIIGTINETYPNGRYPDGMSGAPDADPYKITITQSEGVEYVYVNIEVDQRNEILPPSTAITVSVEPTFMQGNSTFQRFLVAVVKKELDEESKPYISEITNVCPVIYPQTAPECPFLVEDDSRDGDCRVTIRSGLVANALPDDMTLVDTFRLSLADTSNFWVIYCGMVLVDGKIQTDPGNITIFASDSYQESTDTYVYFKLAELNTSLTEAGDRYVSWILNTCAIPFVSSGAGGTPCPYFRVTDATEGEVLRVKVAQSQIANRWPDGMGVGFPPFYLELATNSYIYAAISWDITTLTIGPDSDAITILQSEELLQNTDTMQYILIATVVTGGSPIKITSITNVCTQPQPNPCLLDWSATQ
jgi:hypothetical protein